MGRHNAEPQSNVTPINPLLINIIHTFLAIHRIRYECSINSKLAYVADVLAEAWLG